MLQDTLDTNRLVAFASAVAKKMLMTISLVSLACVAQPKLVHVLLNQSWYNHKGRTLFLSEWSSAAGTTAFSCSGVRAGRPKRCSTRPAHQSRALWANSPLMVFCTVYLMILYTSSCTILQAETLSGIFNLQGYKAMAGILDLQGHTAMTEGQQSPVMEAHTSYQLYSCRTMQHNATYRTTP